MTQSESANLFSALSTELTRYWHNVQSQAERDILSFPPSHVDRLGHTLFSNLIRGGFCTLVVTGRTVWDPRAHYYQAARFAAKRGCQIERAFLLPHKHCRHDRLLQEHQRLDEAAGIITHVFYVGELISTFSLPFAESLDFGLWDDAVGCIEIYKSGGGSGIISEWRVSRRPEDLQLLRQIIAVLKEKAQKISLTKNSAKSELDLEEPMITSAPIAYELAPVLCQGDYVSPENCSWYHSIWQYLRIFDMVSTPTWHANFYLDDLGSLAHSGSFNRILISGTADYSMLAHVIWAYQRAKKVPDVTALDLCETPLFLCKWFAKFAGYMISTVATDIMTLKVSQPFDLIVTDAFLTRFSLPDRAKLISKWRSLLRRGGKIVTTVRLEPDLDHEIVCATPEQADAFRRRALQEARRWQGFLGITPENVAIQAQRYAERMISYAMKSKNEVQELFESGGFEIERLDLAEVPGEMASTTYAEIVAYST